MTSATYRPAPVGRAELLARLERVLHTRGRALLTGPAGVGKTELALATAARTESRGETVLWLPTLPTDRDIPGAAAAALVASVSASVSWPAPGAPDKPAEKGRTGTTGGTDTSAAAGVLEGLPGPQRTAVAMLCREAPIPDGGWDPIALRLALAQILRTLVARGPALLVVDGIQRIDTASADLLRFALHLAPAALRVIAVETPAPYSPDSLTPHAGTPHADAHGGDAQPGDAQHSGTPHAGTRQPDVAGPELLWVPSEADVLFVPPLHADQIAELLIHHRLPSRMAGRIHKASGGNPRLALAVGRSLADARTPVHHAEALSLSGRAREIARQLLGVVSPAVRSTLLLAALALRPTVTLIRRAGRPTASADLAAAERANLISVKEDGTVGFTAGVLPSTLVHDACWDERSAGHAALARVVDDPVEAVRHRALASDTPDEELAAEVAAAADTARLRGNSALAAELALLAADSTPLQHGTKRIARLLDAAQEAARAARADLAIRAATDLLARDATPADRVRARLAVLDTAGQGLSGLDELYVHAMEDSEGDTALRAAVQLRLAVKYVLADGDPQRSRAAAVEAAALAASVGDRKTAARALTVQARMDRVLGSPDAERVLAEARGLEQFERPLGIRNAAQILTIRHALFDDRLTEARDQAHALLPLIERRGPVEDAIELFRTLAEVEARRGQCPAALAHAGRCLALTLEAGLSPGPAWYALALAETAGGSFERAASYARRSVHASGEEGDRVFLPRSLYALGRVQLINGDVASALETLRRVQADERAQSTVDPSMLRWHEELAEALLANDAPQEAAALLADVRPVAERLGLTTVLLGCDRVHALYLAAGGNPDEAVGLLSRTAERFASAGLPLERGRALIALARVERRRRRRSAAQSALQAAAAGFEQAGATPWLGLTTETPSRTAEPSPARGNALSSLTEAELRLAQLVGQGASNQEAAAKLYLSVKTVEARLTRIYQKLDVRSRAQLATSLNAWPGRPAVPATEYPAAG
ncbi:helix-turn-helix transcriptional regulator [Streptomyces finlayi]|uniref:helix-turn-helix transcriptional regulator n=1 Tax=Streptomyces finlayi TaxID=67296 RepID=UPI0021560706|nr:LuxR family transcriptional regulator [Streptomyces finlayi]